MSQCVGTQHRLHVLFSQMNASTDLGSYVSFAIRRRSLVKDCRIHKKFGASEDSETELVVTSLCACFKIDFDLNSKSATWQEAVCVV
ncbi:hypothetical protein chiPu_0000796 [Chiloscyllium punctatum]|uniref:Uncharacterized protein n=1 Tax=Chiloscyllium punctatum TaxID=137246 RepID=A0A401RWA8_CHIPU|nr:hypothetical protein [Chiloscyllium punctatum]